MQVLRLKSDFDGQLDNVVGISTDVERITGICKAFGYHIEPRTATTAWYLCNPAGDQYWRPLNQLTDPEILQNLSSVLEAEDLPEASAPSSLAA